MEQFDITDKQQLRRHFRQQRMRIKKEDQQHWSSQIAHRVLTLPQLKAGSVIFSYLANWGEVDTSALISTTMFAGKTILTPTPDHKLLPEHGFHHITQIHNEAIETQPYNGTLTIHDIDVIIVPGIVWDPFGHRIGFGGGFFDRLLAQKRTSAMAIGLSYDQQIIRKIPNDPWDKAVDIVVTQSRIYE